jgi:cellulose synthase/poly-beta-1,6-N-acetylglucosamine synthase-like glycosyltransferase/peptidoglycan/xylan/chitin deacetylase (PgdA/CDA1 family)
VPRRAVLPRARWLLLAFLTIVFAAMLVFQGYAHNQIGHASTADPGTTSASAVPDLGSGSLLQLAASKPTATAPPKSTVALTFDDGPDATWTPKVLAVLKREHVPATFFLVGSRVIDHPGLVRSELHAGNDIGLHTFTHANLARLPTWEIDLQLSLTKSAIAGAAGVETALVRPPYSSTRAAITNRDYRAWRTVAQRGYVIVLADLDGEDWRPQASVAQILANATPRNERGAIILLHDGGGNRSRTVAAITQLIPRLKARGYRFETVAQLLGRQTRTLTPAPTFDRTRGQLLNDLGTTSGLATYGFVLLVITVTVLSLARILLLVLLARRHRTTVIRRPKPDPDIDAPAVAVIVPAYNEQVGIVSTVTSITASDYPHPIDVVVVDDGSTDDTVAVLEAAIHQQQLGNVRLLRQANRGKAAALNTGLAHTSAPIVIMVDGDTVLDAHAIAELITSFADVTVGAVSGNTKIGNRNGLLGNWQHIEYVIGFNLERRAYDVLNCMPTVPGAIGAFRRSALEQAGGLSDATLAEDTDLTMEVHRAGWRVEYQPTAIAHTEAPSTWRGLWQQRLRWSYGTMQAMWKHRAGLHDTTVEGRRFARRGLTYMTLFHVLLPLFAPLLDAATIYGILFFNPWLMLSYWIGFNLIQLAMGWYAFRLDGEDARALWLAPLQQFVWRQVMYLVIWESLLNAFAGTRLRWHKIPRLGQSPNLAIESR